MSKTEDFIRKNWRGEDHKRNLGAICWTRWSASTARRTCWRAPKICAFRFADGRAAWTRALSQGARRRRGGVRFRPRRSAVRRGIALASWVAMDRANRRCALLAAASIPRIRRSAAALTSKGLLTSTNTRFTRPEALGRRSAGKG